MQTVGAQWLLVAEPNAATLVALVQTAAMVPTLLLALPAGALADIVDRRRLLIGLQTFQLVVGAVPGHAHPDRPVGADCPAGIDLPARLRAGTD